MLSDEHAADAAIEEGRRRVETSRARVKQQLENMDVLVSGCTMEECNGRFQWVADQVIRTILPNLPTTLATLEFGLLGCVCVNLEHTELCCALE